jgi:hypothetical protein
MPQDVREVFGVSVSLLDTVSFKQIGQILELTDRLGLSRERVEIPLSTTSPGFVQKRQNGQIEIVVDADQPFEQWLAAIESEIRRVAAS